MPVGFEAVIEPEAVHQVLCTPYKYTTLEYTTDEYTTLGYTAYERSEKAVFGHQLTRPRRYTRRIWSSHRTGSRTPNTLYTALFEVLSPLSGISFLYETLPLRSIASRYLQRYTRQQKAYTERYAQSSVKQPLK